MNEKDKETLIQLLSNFETRSNKDIRELMRISFDAGQQSSTKRYPSFDDFWTDITRLLDL